VLNFHTNAVSPVIGFLPNDCPVATAKRDSIDNRETDDIERQNYTQYSQHGTKDVFSRILIAASSTQIW
jgi:hypothetical protein